MQITEVITAFLRHEGKILLLQRSSEVGSYQGSWAAVSGHLENDTPLNVHMSRYMRKPVSVESKSV